MDDLIVDRRYLDAITTTLADHLGVPTAVVDEAAPFDLTRLAITDDAALPADRDVTPVLEALRTRLAARFGGWTPLVELDRRDEPGFGAYPDTKHHGIGLLTGFTPDRTTGRPVPSGEGDAGAGVRVGVLDTRLYRHPTLADAVELPVPEDGFTEWTWPADRAPTGQTKPHAIPWQAGHAVFVAGLVHDLAPAATLVVRGVLGPDGTAPVWEVVLGLAALAADGIDVLNISMGCRTDGGQESPVLRRAVDRLSRHTVVVAAAGNHGDFHTMVRGVTRQSPTWPAASPDVTAVGLVDRAHRPVEHSVDLPWVDCTADGVDVVGRFLDGEVDLGGGAVERFDGYARWTGSSFSAARATGAIAALTRPGEVSAANALAIALRQGTVVRPFSWEPA